jgi:hypothetical protein
MLPLQQAYEVKYSIIEYLKATFGFKEKAVQKSFNEFIEREVFKGPYISLKMPFVKANINYNGNIVWENRVFYVSDIGLLFQKHREARSKSNNFISYECPGH